MINVVDNLFMFFDYLDIPFLKKKVSRLFFYWVISIFVMWHISTHFIYKPFVNYLLQLTNIYQQ